MDDQKPLVLLLDEPAAITVLGYSLFRNFRLLKLWESPLPQDLFFKSHSHSVRAAVSSGGFPITADFLRQLPALRLIVTSSVGLNQFDLPECRRRGVAVANPGAAYSVDVADATIGLLLDALRKISAADRFLRKGLWPIQGDYPLGSKLGGKRVGIIGLGSIGSEVARRLDSFGCKISYNSRKKKPSVPYPFYPNVHELASASDVLIICCGLTEKTHRMINREVMLALGRNGIIINIGRGAIIDEKALVRCLEQGEIRGVGLDVFEDEPNVPKELFVLDNVVLTPHNATYTRDSLIAVCELLRDNLEAFFSNKPLLSQVVEEEEEEEEEERVE